MAKSEQVLIRITPERKDEWESELEDSRFSSLAEFIRFAVNNEIDGNHDNSEIVTDTFREVIENKSKDIDSHHSEVIKRLNGIEAAINGVQEEMGGFATVAEDMIIETLPIIDETDFFSDDASPPYDQDVQSEMYEDSMSAEQVADELDVPVEPVRRTLQQLAMKSGRIQVGTGDNSERRYHINV